MKLALRAFGTPQLVYGNIVRASGKFTWAHTWDVLEKGPDKVQLRYTDVSGVGYHRARLPVQPRTAVVRPGDVRHGEGRDRARPLCTSMAPAHACTTSAGSPAQDGRSLSPWSERPLPRRCCPPRCLRQRSCRLRLPFPPSVASTLSYRHHSKLRRKARNLKFQLDEQRESADRLSASLRDLVSELRIEEVLDKITANAKAAVGGKEFALLVRDESDVCHASSSGLPRDLLQALERWAERTPRVFKAPLTIDELTTIDSLAPAGAGQARAGRLAVRRPALLQGRDSWRVGRARTRAAGLPAARHA